MLGIGWEISHACLPSRERCGGLKGSLELSNKRTEVLQLGLGVLIVARSLKGKSGGWASEVFSGSVLLTGVAGIGEELVSDIFG